MPFSSEVIFLGALTQKMPFFSALFFASFGNVLGITLNYFLGIFLFSKMQQKLKSSIVGRKSLFFGHKYGYFILPFSWLPVVGDPLTIVAGVIRLHFFWFLIFAGFFRVLRYFIIGFFY